MCLVYLLYGQLFTNRVLLIVIFPQIAVTKHWSEAMVSFVADDPFLPVHLITFTNSDIWKKPVCIVALLKQEGLPYTAMNEGLKVMLHNVKRYQTHT